MIFKLFLCVYPGAVGYGADMGSGSNSKFKNKY
jgi:hypothetical protein